MIDTVLAFFAGVIVSHWFIWPALALCIFFDHKEVRWLPVVLSMLLAAAVWLIFQPSWRMVLVAVLCYLPIGFCWSFFRYRKYVRGRVKLFNEYHDGRDSSSSFALSERKHLLEKVDISNNVDLVVYWVALWPISLVQSAISDILDAIEHFVTHTIRKVYDKIRDSALQGVTEGQEDGHETP